MCKIKIKNIKIHDMKHDICGFCYNKGIWHVEQEPRAVSDQFFVQAVLKGVGRICVVAE